MISGRPEQGRYKLNRRCSIALIVLLLLQVSATGQAAWDDLIERFNVDAVIKPAASGLSQADLVAGLKEALQKGSRTAVNTLGRENGFFNHPRLKIPLPEKLQGAQAALSAIGQGRIADRFVLSMNRAAERAVPKAGAIFSNAIQSMSIRDAHGILTGADDAATAYLKKHSGARLRAAFLPVVKQATGEAGVTERYKQLTGKLGLMSGLIDVAALDLDQYITTRAVNGVFNLMAEEERLIRQDPAGRTTALLKKVFSQND